VDLRQPKLVGAIHDDRVGGRYIDSVFDDGRANEYIAPLVVEVGHDPLEVPFTHLAVTDGDASIREQIHYPVPGILDRLDLVVQVEHLATAQQLTLDRLLDQAVLPLPDEGLDGEASCGRCRDDRQVPHSRHREIQCAGDGRRGHRQDIHLGAQ